MSRRTLVGLLLVTVALTFGALASSETLRAGASTVVRISPAAQGVSVGLDVEVDVRIDNVTNLGAYEFVFAFDPDVLSFESFADGPFLTSTGRSSFCPPLILEVDIDGDTVADPGFVRVGCASLGDFELDGPTGSGLLATITLGTSCEGASTVGFEQLELTDPLASGDIPATTQSGTVSVTGGSTCTSGSSGDVNCDGTVNPIDAALILQLVAAIINSLPCEENADTNEDGIVNPIDASLILQFVADIIDSLPPS